MEVVGTVFYDDVSEACLEGKMHQHPFGSSSHRAEAPFDMVHSDLMGPVEKPSAVGKNRYVLTFIDDCTRYTWVYFLKKKSHAAERVKRFFAYVKTQFDRQVKALRSD